MIVAIQSVLIVFIILLVSEVLWKLGRLKGELARKFIHIFVGVFVAFWPFYMEFKWIRLISLAFLGVIYISRELKLFHAIEDVKRKTWGDMFFAIGIGLCAVLAPTPWIFTAAILHLSLADGLAAIVGERFGAQNRYKIFGQVKSVAGTLSYWLISLGIMTFTVGAGLIGFNQMVWLLILGLPVSAALLENVSPRGTDNIIVPLFVTITLSSAYYYYLAVNLSI